jgi:hypothetical protein
MTGSKQGFDSLRSVVKLLDELAEFLSGAAGDMARVAEQNRNFLQTPLHSQQALGCLIQKAGLVLALCDGTQGVSHHDPRSDRLGSDGLQIQYVRHL